MAGGVAAARNQGAVASAITVAILLHKAPEGVALGAMLRASTPGPKVAALLCAVAELPTIVGGAVGIWATPPVWADYMLALVSGTFLFLGLHAVLTTRAAGIRRAPTGSGRGKHGAVHAVEEAAVSGQNGSAVFDAGAALDGRFRKVAKLAGDVGDQGERGCDPVRRPP